MKTFKFRYDDADGKAFFKEVTLPDDAAQLVCMLSDGTEIYEGDLLKRHERTYKARLITEAVAEDGCYICKQQMEKSELA